MKKFLQKLIRYWPIFVLIFVEIILFKLNYKPGTFLVGWDNILPELNFPANLERNIFAIWQEYRGLGVLDGMSFAANLPHTILIYLLHFIAPLSMLRYTYIFLTHLLGGIGIYLFLDRYILKKNIHSQIFSLIGSLFYMFNLITIQMFYAPLEAFSTHFAILPWTILSVFYFLEKPNSKRGLLFFITSYLALPQAFVTQLFIVNLVPIFFILLLYFYDLRKKSIKPILVILSILISTNMYWVLPYSYSVITNSQTIINTKINQMSNEDIFLKNKARGDFFDVVTLKGFMLDEVEPLENNDYGFIMKDWRNHINSIPFKVIQIAFFLFVLSGIWYSFYFQKDKIAFPFFASLIFGFIFLGTDLPIIGYLTSFLRDHIPLFREAFRFAFTKFSILYVFSYSIFFVYGIHFFTKEANFRKISFLFFITVILSAITIYSLPSFEGHFFYEQIEQKIPTEYFKTIDYFNSQDKNSRISILPIPTFWSWQYYSWGTRGSGFLWYGINQPTLDMAFDPWSDKNENYYWELSQAIYSRNLNLVERVLNKYQINWILLDENKTNPPSAKALYNDQIENLFNQSNSIKLDQSFGKIKIYKVSLNTPVKDFSFIENNLFSIGPKYNWGNLDTGFLQYGNYQQSSKQPDIYYPFRTLFTSKQQKDIEFEIDNQKDFINFKKKVPYQSNYQLSLPTQNNSELIWVDPNGLNKTGSFSPFVNFDGKEIQVIVPKVINYFSQNINPIDSDLVNNPKQCNDAGEIVNTAKGQVKNEILTENNIQFLRLTASEGKNCTGTFYIPNTPHKFSYLITTKTRNIAGKGFYFWIENLDSQRAEIEVNLPKFKDFITSYFILPPMEEDGLGYTLHFDNNSVGNFQSINDLGEITITPIPYNFLTSIKLTNNLAKAQTYLENYKVSHPNPSLYKINIDQKSSSNNTTLVISQSYNSGWNAYSINGSSVKHINDHVTVNNWENGWMINPNIDKNIIVIYLPQLMEFLGFIFFALGLYLLAFFTFIHKKHTKS